MSNKNIEDVYPLSPAQEGMLFHSLYEAESGVYVSQFTCSLKGLNVNVFEQSWRRVVERHSVLRTAFVWKGVEKNLQVVGRQVKVSVTLLDLRGLSGVEQKERYEAFLREDRKRGFDFSRAPLMRLTLLQVGDDAYRFSWSYHHLLLDGWSMAIVLQEVFSFYDAFQRGEELSLPQPRPYRDYIVWLRQQDMVKAEGYWRRVLAGFSAPTPLNVTRAAGSVPDGDRENNYGKRSRQLAESLTTRLQHLARQHRLTLNTLLQGSWALLLSRYSGERDVVFGAVVSGRPADLAAIESTVGLFINTLPVRIQVEPEAGLLEWLKRLQGQQSEMRQYEHSPLVEVQRWSDVENGVPLFDSYVVFENYTVDEALKDRIEGLGIDDVLSIERSNYPLVLAVLPTKQLTLQIFYERDRFEDATIERMLDHLTTLLEAVGDNPARRLHQMPLLTAAERHRLLVEWNGATADYLPDACIHQLIEAQAARTPDAVAVVDARQRLTYSELDTRSNQLARYLQACGIGPEMRVGLCAKQTVDMVVALLAILKAGGVYVPLDPEHPAERLRFMIEDAAVAALLTHSQFVNLLPQSSATRVVCLDTDWEAIARQGSQTPASNVSGNNLAYVIYTSGSTGRPKGVAVPHAAAVNHCLAVQKEYHLEPSDRVLLFASMSFDVSLEQLLPSLMLGARVVLRGDGVWNAREFVNKLEEEELTIINFPTAYWHQLAQECDAGGEMYAKHKLRLTIVGGDVILPEAVRLWQRTPARDARLLNAYGPTEAIITATLFDIPPGLSDGASLQKLPIGFPVIHRAVYILDQSGEPVPIGVPGELHIGGPLLARGYLNHPALTAEKFIPDAFGETPGARLYKTGDLARRLPDGNIEFLGRVDVQVKIRGFRIELGEIEAALSRHPSIRETVVLARDDSAGDKQIVAYVVCKNGQPPMTREWRDYLSEWLPDYMLPASFVLLDELPLTPHGKVDKQALSTAELSRPKAEGDFVAPLDPVEKQVAEIFAGVLGAEQVGSEDDFFQLGGHSLLATQAVSRLREKFKIQLPFRTLFNEPTVRGLAEIIKQETASNQTPEPAAILPVKRDGHLPLSFAQQRLWFLDQLEPGSALYNVSGAVRLAGALNVTAFGRALNEVLRRHESLRTGFNAVDGRPVQVIASDLTLSLPVINLTGLPAAEREAEALRLAAEEARKPFNLRNPPLLRTTLLRLSEEEHIVLLNMHHIVSDGWSLRLLVKEVGALYEAFLEERPSTLPELKIQYADYAVWQRQWLQGDVLEEQLKYWKQQLAGAATLELPTDRARPARQTFNGARHRFALPEQLTEAVKRLSQQEGATPFMTLLAAFQSLLRRYTGQDDVVVGTPVAGRSRSETEALIGFFVNTLVIRSNVAHDLSFRQMLQHVREATLAAQTHQDLPFELLVEALQPARDLSRHPLFQVMFAMQSALLPEIKLRGLTLSSLEAEHASAKFDLTLEIEEAGERFEGAFEYNADLFDKATIERMSNHFQILLGGIVSNPEQHLSALPLLTEQEREELLVRWNSTSPLPLPTPFIHLLFEEQAARTPDAVAVACEGSTLSYSRLDSEANRLARHLLSLGLRPEEPVALCLHRSPRVVVALLAVLKAGGAYLPLDPSYPQERLGFMAADAGARLVITERESAGAAPAGEYRLVVVDGEDAAAIGGQEPTRPGAAARGADVGGEQLAYIIYTSGSTGRPKGVLVSHAAIARHCLTIREEFALGPADRVLQFASFSFDVSIEQVLATLISGAAVVLRGRELWGVQEAYAHLRGAGVTVATFPPAYWRQLVEQWAGGEAEVLGRLRLITVGGDELGAEALRRWPQTPMRGAEVWNAYGPTEATITVSFYRMSAAGVAAALEGRRRVPIGKGVGGRRLLILDGRGGLAPVGVAGELHIGGWGLSRGYLGAGGLTAEKFVPDPFSGESGARLYKTGDVARRLADGEIEYLGRADHQVKVRGFRVELGEVEAALREQAGVRDAVVVARDDGDGEKRLVGYVVVEAGSGVVAAELRERVRGRLPEHMAPSAVVLLEEFPLTPSGKLDRDALPAPEPSEDDSADTYVAPRTPTEELLAGQWSQILQVERVGLSDNFFQLGGHSLLATQVMSRVLAAFAVELPLRVLFEAPTVEALAARVEEQARAGQAKTVPPLVPVARDGALPLSFAQQRLWFLEQLRPGANVYNIISGLHLDGALNIGALERSFNEVIKRHESLRTNFVAEDGEPVQVISEHASLSLVVEDFSAIAERERPAAVQQFAMAEARRPFNLANDALLRVKLLRLGDEEHVLLLTMHHIISDGWSIGVAVRELIALYEGFVTGAQPTLPASTIQYADFAVWQRNLLQGEELSRLLDYWRGQLAGAPSVLSLPADRQRPAVQSFHGAVHEVKLAGELSAALRTLSRAEGVTLFMTLLAAFDVLLYYFTSEEDIVVGTDVANRNRIETEAVIGFFVNQLVLRTSLSGGPSFRELLQRVRETTLGAYAHQDLPFDRLVEALNPERAARYSPLFQVKLVLQNAPMPTLELGGLSTRSFDIYTETSRLDLLLLLWDEPAGLRGYFEYSTDLFNASTLTRAHELFKAVLNEIVAQPDIEIAELKRRLAEVDEALQSAQRSAHNQSSLLKFKTTRPKTIELLKEDYQ